MKCQGESGVLNWIALRSRPDISCICSTCASLMTVNPQDVMHHIRGIWRYLAATKNEALTFSGNGTSTHMTIASDASFCPGGDRPRTGIVIMWMGSVVHWVCKKQTLATLSSCEAELSASVHGLKIGLGIRSVAEELIGRVLL